MIYFMEKNRHFFNKQASQFAITMMAIVYYGENPQSPDKRKEKKAWVIGQM